MSERSRWEETVIKDEEALEMAPVLDDLLRSPGWAAYMDLLKGARVSAREAAFIAGKDSFEYYQGLVAGLSAASSLPVSLVAQAGDAVKRAQTQDRTRRVPRESSGDTVI